MLKKNSTLGELESEIMEIIWRSPHNSVRTVLTQLEKKRKVAYSTIMTVMTRLYDKGVLQRELDTSGVFWYRAVQDKQHFLASASKKIINRLIREFGDVAIAQFIDVIESSDVKRKARWHKKLKKIK